MWSTCYCSHHYVGCSFDHLCKLLSRCYTCTRLYVCRLMYEMLPQFAPLFRPVNFDSPWCMLKKKRRDGLHSFSFSTSVASGLVYFMRETVVKICTRLGSTAVPVYTFRLLHIFPSSNSDTVSTKHLISLGMPHVTYSWTYMEVQAHFFFFSSK